MLQLKGLQDDIFFCTLCCSLAKYETQRNDSPWSGSRNIGSLVPTFDQWTKMTPYGREKVDLKLLKVKDIKNFRSLDSKKNDKYK